MKHGYTLILKGIIVFVALIVLAGLVWLPQTEGRAANLDLLSIYLDPLIIYVYVASTSFFAGLYQAFKFLNAVDSNKVFTQSSVNIFKNMKFASISLIAFIVLALIYIRFFVHGDDPAGPISLGILTSFAAAVIATVAAVFQKLLQNVVRMKSENDLTV